MRNEVIKIEIIVNRIILFLNSLLKIIEKDNIRKKIKTPFLPPDKIIAINVNINETEITNIFNLL